MSASRPRVLLVCHSASRNGATIVLLELLRWLRSRVDWEIDVLMHGRGPLLADFAALAKTVVWRDPTPVLDAVLRGPVRHIRPLVEKVLSRFQLPNKRYDLVYANTIAAAATAMPVARRAKSLLWHIHELTYALRLTLPAAQLDAALALPTRIVAASDAVKRALNTEFGVALDRIDVVDSFTALRAGPLQHREHQRQRVRAALNWPADAFVVGGCGSLGWRKGTDLFLQLAQTLRRKPGTQEVRLLWVGGQPGSRDWLEFEHDRSRLGLDDCCAIVPSTAGVDDYYAAMDAFALTSREEPLGLVALEAAECGLPVVCFQGSGGAEDFVRGDAGINVPYLDVGAFADALLHLRADPAMRSRMASVGRARVDAGYRVETQAPKLLRAMQDCLAQHPHAAGTGEPPAADPLAIPHAR